MTVTERGEGGAQWGKKEVAGLGRNLWALGDDGEKGSANASDRAVTVGGPLPDGLHGNSVGTEAREARRTLRLREMAAFTATLSRMVFMQRQEARG